MAKAKSLSPAALERLQTKYARPVSKYQEFSGAAYAARIASSVGSAFQTTVSVSQNSTQVNIETGDVNLNELQVYKQGDDYAVGLILHEVGHLKHTPRGTKYRDGWHHELHNLLEDVRMEHLVKQEYAGAPYFIDSINKPAVATITEKAMKPVQPRYGERNRAEQAFYTVIMHAIARAYGAETSSSFPADLSLWDEVATKLSTLMLMSEQASASECVKLAGQARDLVEPLVNPPKAPAAQAQPQKAVSVSVGTPQQQEQGKGNPVPSMGGKEEPKTDEAAPKPGDKKPDEAPVQAPQPQRFDIRPAADKATLLERVQNGSIDHGFTGSQGRSEREPHRYERADTVARLYAANLKRKIISRLRANDKTKVVVGQRRGSLNKKVIAKAAIGSTRLYQRRLQPKKRSYVASVVLDTSASMWNDRDKRIDNAMQASAMLVRTLRSLNIPTALSVYGLETSERLAHTDRYLVPEVSRETGELSSRYYHAGNTFTSNALAAALPKLHKAAHGREQLLILITDGDIGYGEANKCRTLIRTAQKRYALHPVVFYVEASIKNPILNDKACERYIKSASELPRAAAELLASIKSHA